MTDQPIETKTQNSEVGYKRPPVASRFRKGQSGNPRGRRKGQRNLTSVLREVLGQTVTVKRSGKSQRMSKAEALVQVLLSQAHSGDRRAVKAQLDIIEKIGRIHTPEPKPPGAGNYEYMLVPGVSSAEEWQRDMNMRHELAEIGKIVKAGQAVGRFLDADQRAALRRVVETARAAGTTITPRQLDALRESLGLARVAAAVPAAARRQVVRRVVNPIDKRPPPPTNSDDSPTTAAAASQPGAIEPMLESVPAVPRTPVYRKVNRRQPGPPATEA